MTPEVKAVRATRVVATVARRIPAKDTADGVPVVCLDPQLMRRAGVAAGDVVHVDSFDGTGILATVASPEDLADGSDVAQLNRVLRRAARTRPGRSVELVRVDDVGQAQEVVVRLALRMSVPRELEEHVEGWLRAQVAVVSPGTVLSAPMPNSRAALACVVTAVRPAASRVGPSTRIFLEPAAAHGADASSWSDVLYDDVGGLDDVIAVLREAVQLPLERPDLFRRMGIAPSRGVLLHGPPGTGKTRLIRALAGEIDASVHLISGPEIVGTGYGETEKNIRKLFEDAARSAPSVIVLDELDAIAPNRANISSQGDSRAVAQLLAALDGLVAAEGVAVVATTNRLAAVDPAFRRAGRFDQEVFVGPPTAAGRLAILEIHTREMDLSEAARGHLPRMSGATHGFVGADLMQLCREAAMSALRRHVASGQAADAAADEAMSVQVADFEAAMRTVQPAGMRQVRILAGDRGAELVGVEPAQRRLNRFVERSLYALQEAGTGQGWAPGLLITGAPGTGKTELAHALAAEWDANVIFVAGPDVFSKWVGDSEQAVRDLFRTARSLAPAILFLDQLDGIAPVRGGSDGSGTAARVVTQLLAELDDLRPEGRVVVLAATSRPDLVDPSVLRRGRLGNVVRLGSLDEDSRRVLVTRTLHREHGLHLDADSLTLLAGATSHWVASDVLSLCDEMAADLDERPAKGFGTPVSLAEQDVAKWCSYVRSGA
jgi:transitional endoplasmic reticulum ATPase